MSSPYHEPAGESTWFAFASGVPLVAYLATASAHGYWLDSGEFVAAAVGLGISHPPGHPLFALATSAFTFVPVGPLSFRVACASATFAALATGFLYRSVAFTLALCGVRNASLVRPLALAAAWMTAGSFAWWFQSVRPEVYALQAALLLFALERVIRFEFQLPRVTGAPLYVAAFSVGLALANHHLLTFLLFPALASSYARLLLHRGTRALAFSGGFVAMGLAAYAYLPIRAKADPWLNLGNPSSLERFFWVVSAEAFQKNQGDGVPQPLVDRAMSVLVSMVENMHPLALLLAFVGIYTAMRLRSARRVGFAWLMVLAVFTAGRAWLGFVRHNPDALGYLMPGFASIAVFATVAAGVLVVEFAGPRERRPRAFAVWAAWAIAAGSVVQASHAGKRASLASFTATDAFDDPLRRDVPPRAVVLAHAPQTLFRYWGGEAQEHLRPDVTLVPIPLLSYPGLAQRLAEEPELKPLIRDYLLSGSLRQPALQSLAYQRPVLVEMDVRVSPSLFETLVPDGLYHLAIADGAMVDDERDGAKTQQGVWALLEQRLGPAVRTMSSQFVPGFDRETTAQVLWRRYNDALYYAGFGDVEAALRTTRRALELDPRSPQLKGLDAALSNPSQEGPLDVSPFRIGGGQSGGVND